MILPLPEPGYYLVSAVNETSLFGQFTLFSLISMAVILCVVLMFIFYFKWYMNRLLIPLGHLTEGMSRWSTATWIPGWKCADSRISPG